MKIRLVGYFFFLACLACVGQETQFEQILRVEDARRPCQELLLLFNNPEPAVRARAIEAVAKLQDSTCTGGVLRMLADVNHNVRLEAAFALGQLGSFESEPFLLRRLFSKDIIEVRARILEALGKVGSEAAVPVVKKFLSDPEPRIRGEAALAVARLALRGIVHSSLTDSVTTLLRDSDVGVRWKSAYALVRIGRNLDPLALQRALQDEDPQVRMCVVRALGVQRELTIIEPIADVLREDADWRVRVNAARVLGGYPLRLTSNYLSLLNQKQAVRVAIIQAIGTSAALELQGYRANSRELNWAKAQLEDVITGFRSRSSRSAPEVGFSLISYASLMGSAGVPLISRYINDPNSRIRARALEALGKIPSAESGLILERSYHAAPVVAKIAILAALKNFDGEAPSQTFLTALQEEDEVLVALAAEGLAADTVANRRFSKNILQAYQRLKQPIDIESTRSIFRAFSVFHETGAIPFLRQAIQSKDHNIASAARETLQLLTDATIFSPPLAEQGSDEDEFPDYNEIISLNGASALINTSRGSMKLALYAQDAPLTVLNFVRLARSSFYDSLTFHRVVPNFVVQSGDPRGDGWGSPNYTIRSEYNKLHYVRGTLGMASSGKDTEGSQFFITHSPQPHLDGRFTLFGQIVSGFDVLDAIQEGDIIESIAIRSEPFLTGL